MPTLRNRIKLNWPWQPRKFASTVKGQGTWIPNPEGDQMVDGCVWSLGDGMEDKSIKSAAHSRNQYVIYNPRRIIPKYLVKVEFTKEPVKEKLY